MTNHTLAQSYLVKARSRLKILNVLLDDDNYSDVIREAQEIVEQYTRAEAQRAIDDAQLCVDIATLAITTVAPAAGSDTAAPPNTKPSQ